MQTKSLSMIYRLLLACMIGLSIFSLVRVVSNTLDKSGGNDFHQFWYSGQFIRQRADPIFAILNHLDLSEPVYFIDTNSAPAGPVMQDGLSVMPVNTAPMQLLTCLLSFFSWPAAKMMWMVLNLAWILAIPWLVIQTLPGKSNLGRAQKFIYLTFWCLLATRNAAGLGQTTLIVYLFMLLSIYLSKTSWLFAGIALGIALSKYSISIPVLIFFLYKGNWKIILAALATQVIGLLLLAWIIQTPPLALANEYLKIFLFILGEPGIHITSILTFQVAGLVPLIAVFTLLVFGALAWWLVHHPRMRAIRENPLTDSLTLSVLLFWSLLVSYHQEYDVLIIIFYLGLLITMLANGQWIINNRTNKVILITLIVSIAWLCRPGSILLPFLPNNSGRLIKDFSNPATTLVLLLGLGTALFLLYQNLRHKGEIQKIGLL